MSKDSSIGLAEFCEQVKRELLTPEAEGKSSVPIFSVDEVVLQLQVAVSKEGKGGIKIYVLDIGGGAKVDEIQKVTVKLKPILSKEERLNLYKSLNPKSWEQVRRANLNLLKGDQGGSLGNDIGSE